MNKSFNTIRSAIYLVKLWLVFFLWIGCRSTQENEEVENGDESGVPSHIAQPDDSLNRCLKLLELYTQCRQYPDSIEIELQYFEAFPNSFDHLVEAFDWQGCMADSLDVDDQKDPLFLFQSIGQKLEKEKYYSKLIDIGAGGYWMPDGINEFRMFVLNVQFMGDPEPFFVLLDQRADTVADSFLYCVFDKIHAHYDGVPKHLRYLEQKMPIYYHKIEKVIQRIDSISKNSLH